MDDCAGHSAEQPCKEQRPHQSADAPQILADVIETSSQPFLVLDEARRVVRANSAFLEVFQLTEDALAQKTLFEVGEGQWNIPKLSQLLDEILPQHQVVKRYRISHDFGAIGTRRILINARIVADDKTNSNFVLLSFEDITDREDSNKLFDSVIDNLPAMVFLKRASDLRFVRFNRAGENLLGYSRDELVGKNDYDFFPKEQADFFTAVDRKVLAGNDVLHIDEEPIRTRDGETRYLRTSKIVLRDANGEPTHLLGVSLDITDRKHAEGQIRRLVRELDHRVKNVLARIPVVAMSTRDRSETMDDLVNALEGRIRSMGRAHELLSLTQWNGVAIGDIVRRELAPYATDKNTIVEGAEAVLSAEASQAVTMVLHELVTNAAKHGALSVPSGRVLVCWNHGAIGSASKMLLIDWREVDGPPVQSPKRKGYGTSLVRDLIPYELGGSVDLDFAEKGVCCKIGIPFEHKGACHVSASNGSAPAPQ